MIELAVDHSTSGWFPVEDERPGHIFCFHKLLARVAVRALTHSWGRYVLGFRMIFITWLGWCCVNGLTLLPICVTCPVSGRVGLSVRGFWRSL